MIVFQDEVQVAERSFLHVSGSGRHETGRTALVHWLVSGNKKMCRKGCINDKNFQGMGRFYVLRLDYA